MQAVQTLFPVFIMIGLGVVSRIRGWLTPEQKEGAKSLAFSVLFPVLIFNAIFTSQLKAEYLLVIGYVFVMFSIALAIGFLLRKWHGEEYAEVSPYMMTTVEGGNVALPLYLTIVGASYMVNTVMFDMAGSIIAFLIMPAIVAKMSAGNVSIGSLVKTMFTNSFVIAMLLGVVLNLTGVYGMLQQTPLVDIYTSTASMITGPIGGIILFVIGYDLKLEPETLPALLKLTLSRLLFCIVIIIGFFLIFPNMMQGQEFRIAVLLYFMCPTGFAVPIIVSPMCKNDRQSGYLSAFLSMYMVISLIVYTALVVIYG